MESALFGSQSVTRILLYLLVNEKGFGQQIARQLMVPLTPIQKGIKRLEEGGIIKGVSHGKMRLFTLNADYPLLSELEALLKRAYTLLTPNDKKLYLQACEILPTKLRGQRHTLLSTFERLKEVVRVELTSKTRSADKSHWQGTGRGEVVVEQPTSIELIFRERGEFFKEDGTTFTFRNVFRFTLNRSDSLISLEHLRRGMDRPVFLFHLIPTKEKVLESLGSHLCGEDAYFGSIVTDQNKIILNWRIIGPSKHVYLQYKYLLKE